jgi:hypothetical protein
MLWERGKWWLQRVKNESKSNQVMFEQIEEQL